MFHARGKTISHPTVYAADYITIKIMNNAQVTAGENTNMQYSQNICPSVQNNE
jgi:hypothetical protein